jgi:molybdopterin converting factor small subunit
MRICPVIGMMDNMTVSVELFGIHREITGQDRIELPLGEKTLVRDALEYLRRKYPAITLEEHSVLVTVNQEVAPLDAPLNPSDTICILPHIGGG